MQAKISDVDKPFLYLTCSLIAIGLIFVASASWSESYHYTDSAWTFIMKQGIYALLGIPLMFLVSFSHFRWWKKFAWLFAIISLILLIINAKYGVVIGGARRWLNLGFINLQISEFAKIAIVLLLTKCFIDKKKVLTALLISFLMLGLVLKQPDLGSSILISSGIFFVAFASNVPLSLLGVIVVLGGSGAWFHITHTPYQMLRIKYWLDPYSDPLGYGYNLIQSQYAIGSGQLWGLGLGASLQKQGALPISHADFIFSIICEEMGFLGATAFLLIICLWILRALQICYMIPDNFARIMGISLIGLISTQMFINIGVAIGLLPITGMTLPFISYGGSSLISSCIIAGILLNISRFKQW